MITGGRVGTAGCVADERTSTRGRVEVPGCVAIERLVSDCRIVVAGGVVKERPKAGGGVGESGGVVMSAFSPRAVLRLLKHPSWQTARAAGENEKEMSATAIRCGRIVTFLQ